MASDLQDSFWRTKRLEDMNDAEWEALCDHCGKCCLVRLEDDLTGEIFDTDVSCRLFDRDACHCTDYANRTVRVSGCVKLTPEELGRLNWMPRTCAYRLLFEGKPLPWWHPLVSGDPETVHLAGVSVRGKTVPEDDVPEETLEDRAAVWPGER